MASSQQRTFHSRCVQLNVGSISDAVSIFSKKNERGEVPLVLIPAHRSPFSGTGWWLTIPTGCNCLMQRFGKDIGIAPPGGSVKPPFYRIAYIVTSQSCNYNAPVKECPTADNVRVGVDVHIVFNIQNPQDFVYKLGAVHFDQLLSGAVDEGIRVLVRAQTHQTVRMLRGNRADTLLSMLNKKFDDSGVKFQNCTITQVELPQSLEQSLEHTTELRKAMEKTKREHDFMMGEIQRKCDMDLEELNRKNEQTIVMEQGRKKRAELNHEQRLVKEEELTSTAMIEAQQRSKVGSMEVNAMLERTKVEVEQHRLETISRAEADAEARRVQADIDYEKALMTATAEKERLVGEAEAIRLDAQAEAESSQHLIHKRRHELTMREKDVLMQLASKTDYNLIGNPGDRLVDAMMSGHLEVEKDKNC
uniref:Band 7 domain-containing protein n=1 Tax=Alexandrium catenella TaxID=2925 RepID=A0A7S1SFK6_ALECA|mmetsp:Transcript_9939/g.27055  ORF Transcript_9939/g.27055 Transcript_9939/m.27055 type:complete len:419 (+) Transcript_9939:113-1369(+)|eukprot:CAMPEP_0171191454 /NCGR_PEP_ID=MMETSP0790-20130122/19370_1 /TAXON_ID=2925 /ORGANISM="Alexandrium catenella, Strain OF101" /LENGTH=418 /DNA_ID=CAMNT_0011656597 /DNA_START=40 /DNA_END=1296 /DNA_ORIENTATION=-